MITSAEILSIFSKHLIFLRRLSFFRSKVEEGLSFVWGWFVFWIFLVWFCFFLLCVGFFFFLTHTCVSPKLGKNLCFTCHKACCCSRDKSGLMIVEEGNVLTQNSVSVLGLLSLSKIYLALNLCFC